jgi:hypothetical protein
LDITTTTALHALTKIVLQDRYYYLSCHLSIYL